MSRPVTAVFTAALLWSAGLTTAHAAEVIRHKTPNSDFPIAAAVEIPAGKATVYVSGKVPAVVDASAPKDSAAAYGDT
ncbi:MAG: hypothetical protein EOO78_24810, partial [Oxalobacteraceae bacterium]